MTTTMMMDSIHAPTRRYVELQNTAQEMPGGAKARRMSIIDRGGS